MPVYLVEVNRFKHNGLRNWPPELMGITFKHDARAAVEWTLQGEDITYLRDVTVRRLSMREDCWYQSGPEEEQ